MPTQTESPFTTVKGLGSLRHVYRRGKRTRLNLIFGLLCLLAAPGICLLSAYLSYDTYNHYGSSRAWERILDIDSGVGLTLCFGLGALALGAWIVWEIWWNWPVTAAIYENGLVYRDRGSLKQVRWEEVDHVKQSVTKHYRNGVYVGTTHLYILQARDRLTIKLDDKLDNVAELGNDIQRATATVLFPHYWQAVQNGQRVTFGPLALDLKGLYNNKQELIGPDIKEVKIERGVISVRQEKGWLNWTTVTVPQIPNFWIFYELLGRFTTLE